MEASKTITVMIESPKGFNQKFNYDPAERRFTLSKILPAELVFPFDFGMIPGTKGADGDPLDIIVISESATFPGCMMECRIIGALQAEQTEVDGKRVRNDRFLGVPVVSQLFPDINDLAGLPESVLNQLEHFLRITMNRQVNSSGSLRCLPAGQAADLLP
jgi:inorganic pyrophosphatase